MSFTPKALHNKQGRHASVFGAGVFAYCVFHEGQTSVASREEPARSDARIFGKDLPQSGIADYANDMAWKWINGTSGI
jgi:hypothetical protein